MEKTEQPAEEPESGFFSRLKSGLQKTRSSLAGGLENIVQGKAEVGPELLEELEESLLIADVGMETTTFILEDLKKDVAQNHIRSNDEVLQQLKGRMIEVLSQNINPIIFTKNKPLVILIVGINGSGKTTTIGKLAQRWKLEGKKVLLAKKGLGFSENFFYMCFGTIPSKEIVKAFDVSLILYEEHSFNVSTFTARTITSSLSDIHSAITGAWFG